MMGLSNLIQSIGYSVRENYENNYGTASYKHYSAVPNE